MARDKQRWSPWAVALFCTLSPLAALAQQAGLPRVDSGGWSIRLIRLERSGSEYGDYSFTLSARPQAGGPERILKLENETTALKRLEVVGERLIVFGEVGGAGDMVSVLELATGKVAAAFLCYGPELSPNRRYVLARAYYPRFADVQATSDVLLIADLGAGRAPAPRAIFPAENAASGQLNAWVEKASDRHTIDPRTRYRWDARESRVAFIDHTGGESWLVILRLDGGEVGGSSRYRLDIASLLSTQPSDPAYAMILERERQNAAVEELSWQGEQAVVIRFDRARWAADKLYRSSELVVKLDDADPAGAAP